MLKVLSDLCYKEDIKITSQFTKTIGFFGDVHADAKGFDKDLFYEHLDECAKRKAPAVFIGDLFDAMQGRNDRRGSKSSVISQASEDDYFNRLVEYIANLLAPKLKKIPYCICMSGNHETAITRHNEIDLLKMLQHSLYVKGVKNFYPMGYRGYLKISASRSGARRDVNLFMHHGYGGGQRSKGTLKADIMQGIYSSADVIVTGHVHMQWGLPLYRLKLNNQGVEKKEEVVHIQVPSYKDDITNKKGGYAIEKGYSPSALGGYFIDIQLKRDKTNGGDTIQFKIRETRM